MKFLSAFLFTFILMFSYFVNNTFAAQDSFYLDPGYNTEDRRQYLKSLYCDYQLNITAGITAYQHYKTGRYAIEVKAARTFNGYVTGTDVSVFRNTSYLVDNYNGLSYRYTDTYCKNAETTDVTVFIQENVGYSSSGVPWYEIEFGKMTYCPNKSTCGIPFAALMINR